MKKLGILFFFTFSINLSAQLYVARAVGQDFGLFDAISNNNTESYEGNPYLNKEWRNVAITTVSGEEMSFEKAKLDIWQHILIVNKEGFDKTANNHLIAIIDFDEGTIKKESFMKIGVNNKLRFAKFLKQGRIKLFEVYTKNFNKVRKDPNASGYDKKLKSSFSSLKKKFYISIDDEELVELKASKKGFIKSFPEEYKSKISGLFKSQKPNLKDASELIAFLGGIEEGL
ncbi:MAG: hypothetical protein ACJA01_001131 [Saprospiraceae bacterium]|jgi:hypothetical protein